MVELKIRKFGNSLGVVLPKNVLARLSAREGDALYLTESPQGNYRLSCFNPEFEEKIAKAESIMARYKNTLRVLAK